MVNNSDAEVEINVNTDTMKNLGTAITSAGLMGQAGTGTRFFLYDLLDSNDLKKVSMILEFGLLITNFSRLKPL